MNVTWGTLLLAISRRKFLNLKVVNATSLSLSSRRVGVLFSFINTATACPFLSYNDFPFKIPKRETARRNLISIVVVMAQADSNPETKFMDKESEEKRLKYLEFVQVATLHALICASRLYNYAKEKSGPLKPGIHSVEDTVKNVVSPVYDKYHDLPIEVLMFVDRKVDESVNKVQNRVPPTLKQVSSQAIETAQKAPEAARSVLADVKNVGMVETASGLAKTVYTRCEPTAKYMYTKYEPVAEQCAVSAWQSLNKLPLFPQVAQAVAPTASYCSEKYNQAVQVSADKGFKVASYLPLVPTEKIAKMLNTGNVEPLVSGVQ